MISRLDDQFGRIVQKIDNLNLWDSTITLFFTDHGEYLGDHGLVEKWPTGMSDVLTRNPVLIAGAGLPSQNTFTHMAEMVDLLPTIFQLCSIPTRFPTNGKSWLPSILAPRTTPHKDFVFIEAGYLASEEPLIETSPFPYDIKADLQHEDPTLVGRAIAIRSLEWTFVYRLCEPAELYSRNDDPAELHNLAARPEYQHVVRMLEAVLLRWQVETSDFLPWRIDPRVPDIELEDPRSQWLKRVNRAKVLDRKEVGT
jgi:arylsulfatase A-like enzyme